VRKKKEDLPQLASFLKGEREKKRIRTGLYYLFFPGEKGQKKKKKTLITSKTKKEGR